jgi:hypothetical protein
MAVQQETCNCAHRGERDENEGVAGPMGQLGPPPFDRSTALRGVSPFVKATWPKGGAPGRDGTRIALVHLRDSACSAIPG